MALRRGVRVRPEGGTLEVGEAPATAPEVFCAACTVRERREVRHAGPECAAPQRVGTPAAHSYGAVSFYYTTAENAPDLADTPDLEDWEEDDAVPSRPAESPIRRLRRRLMGTVLSTAPPMPTMTGPPPPVARRPSATYGASEPCGAGCGHPASLHHPHTGCPLCDCTAHDPALAQPFCEHTGQTIDGPTHCYRLHLIGSRFCSDHGPRRAVVSFATSDGPPPPPENRRVRR